MPVLLSNTILSAYRDRVGVAVDDVRVAAHRDRVVAVVVREIADDRAVLIEDVDVALIIGRRAGDRRAGQFVTEDRELVRRERRQRDGGRRRRWDRSRRDAGCRRRRRRRPDQVDGTGGRLHDGGRRRNRRRRDDRPARRRRRRQQRSGAGQDGRNRDEGRRGGRRGRCRRRGARLRLRDLRRAAALREGHDEVFVRRRRRQRRRRSAQRRERSARQHAAQDRSEDGAGDEGSQCSTRQMRSAPTAPIMAFGIQADKYGFSAPLRAERDEGRHDDEVDEEQEDRQRDPEGAPLLAEPYRERKCDHYGDQRRERERQFLR